MQARDFYSARAEKSVTLSLTNSPFGVGIIDAMLRAAE